MTEYPQYPNRPTPDAHGAVRRPDRGPRPASVSLAIKLIWVAIALSVVSAIVTFIVIDDLVEQSLQQTSVQGVTEDTVRAGITIGIVVGLVIGVGLNVLWAIFLGRGANWARIVYTVLAALGIVFGLIGLAGGGAGPAVLTILSVVGMLVSAATLVLLWKRESRAWFATPRFPVG